MRRQYRRIITRADAMLRNYTYHHASRRRIFVKKQQLEDGFEGSGDLTSSNDAASCVTCDGAGCRIHVARLQRNATSSNKCQALSICGEKQEIVV